MSVLASVVSDFKAYKASLDDQTTWQASFLKAIGFEVAQHVRNRLALALVVFFIPVWLGIVRAIIPSDFAAVRRSSAFDQRLVLAGHSRACLLAAKLVGLLLVSAVVAGYAGMVMAMYWDPVQPG